MMHIISETAVYVAICAALPVILLIGEIKEAIAISHPSKKY